MTRLTLGFVNAKTVAASCMMTRHHQTGPDRHTSPLLFWCSRWTSCDNNPMILPCGVDCSLSLFSQRMFSAGRATLNRPTINWSVSIGTISSKQQRGAVQYYFFLFQIISAPVTREWNTETTTPTAHYLKSTETTWLQLGTRWPSQVSSGRKAEMSQSSEGNNRYRALSSGGF